MWPLTSSNLLSRACNPFCRGHAETDKGERIRGAKMTPRRWCNGSGAP
jgi:hypothetical protein